MPRRFHPRSDPAGFTLPELLIVLIILAILAGVAIPIVGWPGSHRKAVVKEAQTNLMNIAAALEQAQAGGKSPSYSVNGRADGCPGLALYVHNGIPVDGLPVAIQGDYYGYILQATDPDGDGVCECYRLAAVGLFDPATDADKTPLTFDCHFTKTGPWR